MCRTVTIVKVFERVATFGASVAIIATATYGWWEYTSSVQQGQINRSYAYSHEFRTAYMAEKRNIIKNKLYRDYVQLEAKATNEEKSPDVSICLGWIAIEAEPRQLTDPDRSRDTKCNALNFVLEFFDDAYECVKRGGCHKDTMSQLLSKEARKIWGLVYPYVKAGTQDQRYGLGLMCIRDSFKCEDMTVGK